MSSCASMRRWMRSSCCSCSSRSRLSSSCVTSPSLHRWLCARACIRVQVCTVRFYICMCMHACRPMRTFMLIDLSVGMCACMCACARACVHPCVRAFAFTFPFTLVLIYVSTLVCACALAYGVRIRLRVHVCVHTCTFARAPRAVTSLRASFSDPPTVLPPGVARDPLRGAARMLRPGLIVTT